MKILIVGANGLIGGAIADRLSVKHELIRAGHSGGDVQVDLGSKASVEGMFEAAGPVDAVVCAAGLANFGAFKELDDGDFDLALSNKLMGQVNLVRVGQNHIRDGGSFTLTSGILSQEPSPGSSVLSMVNGGLESFAKAAALELERDMRVNVVSPDFVKETMEMMGMDSAAGISAADTAKAYEAAVEGQHNGATLAARDYA
ncbi:short chain dehydrogenase [Phaeobacter gallaeciensis]|uniref:Dehydrogenase with variable specificity n=1 Tax=Phaeobacter gallaeciensis TaxID=60890 RepID=A0AAD0EAZ5_9RHOB|nr:short chain dehydrogenase [Phaeobacter gallaeciensis]AHD09154.1 Dehydrogenase with variable specificity [Phaeobacter gallaeciensis DSM 26640]ATE92417.1 Dehydrogenase with variable specificity [Phaeobacter gallaeciensis]ATE97761.1 Dehydrogenase with variable specificity [Phaeobacter gallaeciensis]ATF01082.1 Dehydrogenase with variable specificity [Phaeobacter gallaeciensis]ATF05462.1 Dehydrogenase with variable specificity [Phaeobacter gallaeciensis]